MRDRWSKRLHQGVGRWRRKRRRHRKTHAHFDFRCGSDQGLVHGEELNRQLFEEPECLHRLGRTHAPLDIEKPQFIQLRIARVRAFS